MYNVPFCRESLFPCGKAAFYALVCLKTSVVAPRAFRLYIRYNKQHLFLLLLPLALLAGKVRRSLTVLCKI